MKSLENINRWLLLLLLIFSLNAVAQTEDEVYKVKFTEFLTLDYTIDSIDMETIRDVKNIVSYNLVPPICKLGVVDDSYWADRSVNLYVPEESVISYSSKKPWNMCNIYGICCKDVLGDKKGLVCGRLVDGNFIKKDIIKKGVYKHVQYKRGDLPIEKVPFDIYKLLSGDIDTLQLNDNLISIENKAKQMDIYTTKYKDVEIVNFVIANSKLDVIDQGKKGFINRWVCDMKNHRTIPYGTLVKEVFRKDVQPSKAFKEIRKVFIQKPIKDIPIIGAWKLKGENSKQIYVYGKEHMIVLNEKYDSRQGNFYKGTIDKLEYTKENQFKVRDCLFNIKWLGLDNFTMTTEQNGQLYIIEAEWERCNIEDLVKYFK